MKAGTNSRRVVQKRAARRGRSSADVAAPEVVATPVAVLPQVEARSDVVFALQAECTARCAEQLKESLLEKVAAPAVSIDIAGVERVDTVCLQLLVAFVRDRRKTGRGVTWAGSSPSFVQAATLLGLASVLGVAAAG